MTHTRPTSSDLSVDNTFSRDIVVFSSNPIVVYLLVFLAIQQPIHDCVRYILLIAPTGVRSTSSD